MYEIEIQTIHKSEEVSGTNKSGRAYTVHKYLCTGTVNGEQTPEAKLFVETLSGKVANAVQDGVASGGWKGLAEQKEYRGNIYYFLPTPKMADSGKGGGRMKPMYSQDEYEALFRHATVFVMQLGIDMGIKDLSVLVPMISTYMIGASDRGIKVIGVEDMPKLNKKRTTKKKEDEPEDKKDDDNLPF